MEKGTQLSEKVTQILLHEIRNGDFNGLDSLPPEVELAEKFNVSRNVIRESLGSAKTWHRYADQQERGSC